MLIDEIKKILSAFFFHRQLSCQDMFLSLECKNKSLFQEKLTHDPNNLSSSANINVAEFMGCVVLSIRKTYCGPHPHGVIYSAEQWAVYIFNEIAPSAFQFECSMNIFIWLSLPFELPPCPNV